MATDGFGNLDPRVVDTIIAEAGNNVAGQRAVAAAIINRAKAQGKTPLQIVQQSGQFEGYSNPGRASREAQKSPHIRALAEKAYNDIVSGAVPDPTNGGTQFRAASASGVLGKNVVNIGGNVFKLGNAPSPLIPQSAVAAIQAAAPIPQPRPLAPEVNAYASAPASLGHGQIIIKDGKYYQNVQLTGGVNGTADAQGRPATWGLEQTNVGQNGTPLPPIPAPIPRPNYPTGGSPTLMPFAGGLDAQPQGAGDSWGQLANSWGPSNFRNAFPQAPTPSPSDALTSRSVHTVQIDPFTGNPVGSNTPFVSADHPLSNAVAPASPKTIYYNSTAGNVALPKDVVPASVTRDLASIAEQQMNRSGSPDDRQAPAPQIAPTPMPGRPAFNTPYIPGPNGSNIANKDTSSLQPSTPLAFGSPVQSAPAVQAITKQIVNPDYTKWVASNTQPLKAGQAYTAGGNIVTQAQQNAFGGLSSIPVPPPSIPIRTPAPSKYITVKVPGVTQPNVPLPRPRPATPTTNNGGLLGLLFPGTDTNAFSLMGNGISSLFGGGSSPAAPRNSAPVSMAPAPATARFLSDRGVDSSNMTIGQQMNALQKSLEGRD